MVFNYAGMGLAFYRPRSTMTLRCCSVTVLATAATIVGNLLADIGYAVLDPRVRY